MDDKHHALLFTLFGLASVVALGVVLGAVSRDRRPARRLRRRVGSRGAPDRESLEHLAEKFARTMPEDEARALLSRNREQLKHW